MINAKYFGQCLTQCAQCILVLLLLLLLLLLYDYFLSHLKNILVLSQDLNLSLRETLGHQYCTKLGEHVHMELLKEERISQSYCPILKGHPRSARTSRLLVTLKTYICI